MKWNGLGELESHLKPLDKLKPGDQNPRRHSERQITAFMNALQELGQHRLAVIDIDGRVIIGNAMLEAAKRLGWSHLAVVQAGDGKDCLRALTDNSISDLASWNEPEKARLVHELHEEGIDLKEFGWTASELQKELAQLTASLNDEVAELAQAIEAEEEISMVSEDAQAVASKLSEKIRKRLNELAIQRPEALTKALAVILDREGGKPLFVLLDPNTKDLIVELKRLSEAEDIPEGSPLAVLSEGLNI